LGDVCVRSQNGVVRCGADPITSHPEAMRLFEHRGTACLVTTSGDELCRDSEWISHGEYDGSFEAAPDGYRWWCEFEESLVRCWGRNAFEALAPGSSDTNVPHSAPLVLEIDNI